MPASSHEAIEFHMECWKLLLNDWFLPGEGVTVAILSDVLPSVTWIFYPLMMFSRSQGTVPLIYTWNLKSL